MAMTNLNLRLDSDIKEQVENILNDMGLNFTTAVNIYFKQILRTGEIPFKIKVDIPNSETVKAIEEAECLIKQSDKKYYNNARELFSSIEMEEDEDV